jgi:hypothetical protein
MYTAPELIGSSAMVHLCDRQFLGLSTDRPAKGMLRVAQSRAMILAYPLGVRFSALRT